MPDKPSTTTAQLGAELHAARRLSGLDQRQLASRSGISQATVSRVERGLRLLDRGAVTAWLQAVEAPDDVRDRVLALIQVAHGETRTWRDLLADDRHLQDEMRARTAGAAVVRNFQPATMPGLLQTADYARLIIAITDPDDEVDRDGALASRIAHQGLLRETGRRFDFIVAERLLRWEPAPGVLVPQLAHLASAAQLDTVRLAVLPDSYGAASPGHNFVLLEPSDGSAPYVSVELAHGESLVTEPESVAVYRRAWDRLWAASLTGDDAVQLIRGEVARTA